MAGEHSKVILSVNSGSSSVKLSLYSASFSATPEALVSSSIANIKSPPVIFSYTNLSSPSGSSNIHKKVLPDVSSQEEALQCFLKHLASDSDLPIKSEEDIELACHRIVHGGDFDKAMVLSKETIKEIEDLTELAPLHNPPALSLVHTTISQLPRAKNIAYFDTTFYSTLPAAVKTYAINQHNPKLRKYGFHGISYSFILDEVAKYLGKPPSDTSIIALHLGSGASACAIQRGESIDTSMGLTPAEGLPGATRSGAVDPTLVFHTTSSASSLSHESTEDLRITKAEEILNKHSGWFSLTGTTDFSRIASGWEEGKEKEALAFELVVDRIVGYVGSYWAKLGGECDALVFSGGIGEKYWQLRREVGERCRCLGFNIEERKNRGIEGREGTVVGMGGEQMGNAKGGRVLVCRTDEEWMMARECARDERFW